MTEIPPELKRMAQHKREMASFVRELAATLTTERGRAKTLARAEALEREATEIEGWAEPK